MKVQIVGPDAMMTEGATMSGRKLESICALHQDTPLKDGLFQVGDADEERRPAREFGVPRRRVDGKRCSPGIGPFESSHQG